jgi:hypothetical protein
MLVNREYTQTENMKIVKGRKDQIPGMSNARSIEKKKDTHYETK